MPFVFLGFSVLLLGLGGALYWVDGARTVTPYVCGGFGLTLLACGILNLALPRLRSVLLYVATVLGVAGTARGIGFSLAVILRQDTQTVAIPLATYAQFTMGILCAVLLAICVKTIRDNRRARIPNF